MRNWKAYLILLALLVFWLLMLMFMGVEVRGAERPADDRGQLVDQMATGFVKMIRAEGGGHWYDCGVPTPRGEWKERAAVMAVALLDALDEYRVQVSPWGPWATIYKESRGNRCSIGPNPLKVARRWGHDKPWREWTEADILAVVESPRWGKRTADLGLGQVVWRRWARFEKNGRVRVPTAREMLDLEDGARVLAYGMKSRQFARTSKQLRGKPWAFWPGSVPCFDYLRDVASIARRMGGPSI